MFRFGPELGVLAPNRYCIVHHRQSPRRFDARCFRMNARLVETGEWPEMSLANATWIQIAIECRTRASV